MVRAGQMAWHQMKQGFTWSHLGHIDQHTRPVSYRTFCFVFGKASRTIHGIWLAGRVQLLALLDGELTLSTMALLSFLFSSLWYWLIIKGPAASGNAKVTKGSPPLCPDLVGGHWGVHSKGTNSYCTKHWARNAVRDNRQVPWRCQKKKTMLDLGMVSWKSFMKNSSLLVVRR